MKILKLLFFFGVFAFLAKTSAFGASVGEAALNDMPVHKMAPFYVSGLGQQVSVWWVYPKKGTNALTSDVNKSDDGKLAFLVITEVAKGTPAEKAGLRKYMLVSRIQGLLIEGLTSDEFERKAGSLPKGNSIRVSVVPDPRKAVIESHEIPVIRLPKSDIVASAP